MPLSFGLGLLKQLLPVPTHIFKADDHYFEKFESEQSDDWNVLKTDYAFRKEILREVRSKGVTLICKERPVIYAGVVCSADLTLVVGPVTAVPVDQSFFKLYALKHQAQNCSIQTVNIKKLASFILLIYSAVSGGSMYLSDFLDANFISEEIIENTQKQLGEIITNEITQSKTHNPGSFEEQIKSAIRAGDVDALKKAHNSIYASMRGTVARNELRNAQDLAIVDITIATRAAIDAGLGVEEMYVISDAFILEVEDCRYVTDAEALARACALRCTQMVYSMLQKRLNSDINSSGIVFRACEYLEKHVYEKFDLESLCTKLKVSPGYLSKLFRQERHMTLSDYFRKRKVETAKILLSTTSKSLSEISDMLNFNSQSHFGRIFSKEAGVTPAVFRKRSLLKRLS